MTTTDEWWRQMSFGDLRKIADDLANNAGLDKLPPMNRDELNDWVRNHVHRSPGGFGPDKFWLMPETGGRTNGLSDGSRPTINAAALMEELAERFRERNGKYKDNWRNLGDVMVALYPDGVTLRTADDFVKFHLLEWTLGKITRFVNAEDGDSIEDAAVYAAMIGSYLRSLA